MWPTEAMTCQPAPRYFEIDFILPGDSTINKFIKSSLNKKRPARGVKGGTTEEENEY
jgi:hypothetical protein